MFQKIHFVYLKRTWVDERLKHTKESYIYKDMDVDQVLIHDRTKPFKVVRKQINVLTLKKSKNKTFNSVLYGGGVSDLTE